MPERLPQCWTRMERPWAEVRHGVEGFVHLAGATLTVIPDKAPGGRGPHRERIEWLWIVRIMGKPVDQVRDERHSPPFGWAEHLLEAALKGAKLTPADGPPGPIKLAPKLPRPRV